MGWRRGMAGSCGVGRLPIIVVPGDGKVFGEKPG